MWTLHDELKGTIAGLHCTMGFDVRIKTGQAVRAVLAR